ncbi:alpha/beta fold hydrolase [Pseudonocardia sp. CA-107938]|uniref:alpha/beta fold hydrolase n=1 Tax=Pseudonocardia sp. CA-107938 TaxID=3240021 RepID=UPI003D8E883B
MTTHVRTSAGTDIAFERVGSGPPVVVLPGALNLGESWRAVALELADEYTFLLVDRRSSGASGPGPEPATFAAEIEDVRAVLDVAREWADAPAHLLGHSYGALLALHTVRADPSGIASLLLYEAPVLAGDAPVASVLDRFRVLRAAGDHAGALGLFLTEVVGLGPEELAAMDGPDAGPEIDLAGLTAFLQHDIEALTGLPTPDTWHGIDVPVLLMAGADSWPMLQRSTAALQAALPHAELVPWPGQTHFANLLDPGLVAVTIREFIARKAILPLRQ